MIPLMLPGAIPWRLIGYGAAVAAILLLGWRVHAWREAFKAYPAAVAALKAEQGCEVGSKCSARQAALEARQAQVSKEVRDDYEKELADLRNRPVPARVIRVCRAANPGDLSGAGATAGAHGAAAPGGIVLGSDEFSTAPLRELAREADEIAARLRALQGFNRALSGK